MNCLECRNLLQRRMDGETLASADLDAHLAGCAECRGLQASSVRLLEGLRHLPDAKPPVGFSQRLTGLVLRDRERRRRRWRWTVGVAIAASILVAIVLSNQRPDQPTKDPRPQVVKDKDQRPKDTPGLNVTFEEGRIAVVSLMERMTKNTKDNAQYLISAAASEVQKDDPVPDVAKTVLDAGQGVSDTVQPVAQSARRAVDYFFKGIPVAKTKTTN